MWPAVAKFLFLHNTTKKNSNKLNLRDSKDLVTFFSYYLPQSIYENDTDKFRSAVAGV